VAARLRVVTPVASAGIGGELWAAVRQGVP